MRKMIKNSVPIDFKIAANKFIKLKELENQDNIEKISEKINENIEMYKLYYITIV
jgi:hypothetical protein